MHDKAEYIIHIRDLKQTLNLTLILEKVHSVIRFNQNAWLKPYIGTNTDLRKKQKMILKKILLSWWIMQFLEKLCHNRKKKKLFCVRTKLSYYEVFHRKFIRNRNDKNT